MSVSLAKSRIVFIGDQDNIGTHLYLRCRERDIPCSVIMMALGRNRSDPRDAIPDFNFKEHPDFFVPASPADFVQTIRSLEKYDSLVVGSSGIELQYSLDCQKKHPVFFVPTGSDLSMWPFVTPETALLKNYLEYKEVFMSNRHRINFVFDSSLKGFIASQMLGIVHRYRQWVYPVPQSALVYRLRFGPQSPQAKRIIGQLKRNRFLLLPTRKNFDPSFNAYKGAEKILKALTIIAELSPTLCKEFAVLNVQFGNGKGQYSAEAFTESLNNICRTHSIRCVTTPPLPRHVVWDLFSSPKSIILDSFPLFPNSILGGTARECLLFGRPIITGDIGPFDSYALQLYGTDKVPIDYAVEASGIATSLRGELLKDHSRVVTESIFRRRWASSRFDPARAYDQIIDTTLST